MPTKIKYTISTKTSSKKVTKQGVKAPKPTGNAAPMKMNPNMLVGLNLQMDKEPEAERSPIKLLFADRTKPVMVNKEFLVVEGKVSEEEREDPNQFLFCQNPYSSSFQKFKVGDKAEYIHVLRNDNKVEYLFTLTGVEVKRIEFKVGSRARWENDESPIEMTLLTFKDRIVDTEAKKLYNTVLGKGR